MKFTNEVSLKIRTAIKVKLAELGNDVYEELPDYIMVMIANKKSQEQMTEDLTLFLGDNANAFSVWLHGLLVKLQSIAIDSFGDRRINSKPGQSVTPIANSPNNSNKFRDSESEADQSDSINSDAEQSNENVSEGDIAYTDVVAENAAQSRSEGEISDDDDEVPNEGKVVSLSVTKLSDKESCVVCLQESGADSLINYDNDKEINVESLNQTAAIELTSVCTSNTIECDENVEEQSDTKTRRIRIKSRKTSKKKENEDVASFSVDQSANSMHTHGDLRGKEKNSDKQSSDSETETRIVSFTIKSRSRKLDSAPELKDMENVNSTSPVENQQITNMIANRTLSFTKSPQSESPKPLQSKSIPDQLSISCDPLEGLETEGVQIVKDSIDTCKEILQTFLTDENASSVNSEQTGIAKSCLIDHEVVTLITQPTDVQNTEETDNSSTSGESETCENINNLFLKNTVDINNKTDNLSLTTETGGRDTYISELGSEADYKAGLDLRLKQTETNLESKVSQTVLNENAVTKIIGSNKTLRKDESSPVKPEDCIPAKRDSKDESSDAFRQKDKSVSDERALYQKESNKSDEKVPDQEETKLSQESKDSTKLARLETEVESRVVRIKHKYRSSTEDQKDTDATKSPVKISVVTVENIEPSKEEAENAPNENINKKCDTKVGNSISEHQLDLGENQEIRKIKVKARKIDPRMIKDPPVTYTYDAIMQVKPFAKSPNLASGTSPRAPVQNDKVENDARKALAEKKIDSGMRVIKVQPYRPKTDGANAKSSAATPPPSLSSSNSNVASAAESEQSVTADKGVLAVKNCDRKLLEKTFSAKPLNSKEHEQESDLKAKKSGRSKTKYEPKVMVIDSDSDSSVKQSSKRVSLRESGKTVRLDPESLKAIELWSKQGPTSVRDLVRSDGKSHREEHLSIKQNSGLKKPDTSDSDSAADSEESDSEPESTSDSSSSEEQRGRHLNAGRSGSRPDNMASRNDGRERKRRQEQISRQLAAAEPKARIFQRGGRNPQGNSRMQVTRNWDADAAWSRSRSPAGQVSKGTRSVASRSVSPPGKTKARNAGFGSRSTSPLGRIRNDNRSIRSQSRSSLGQIRRGDRDIGSRSRSPVRQQQNRNSNRNNRGKNFDRINRRQNRGMQQNRNERGNRGNARFGERSGGVNRNRSRSDDARLRAGHFRHQNDRRPVTRELEAERVLHRKSGDSIFQVTGRETGHESKAKMKKSTPEKSPSQRDHQTPAVNRRAALRESPSNRKSDHPVLPSPDSRKMQNPERLMSCKWSEHSESAGHPTTGIPISPRKRRAEKSPSPRNRKLDRKISPGHQTTSSDKQRGNRSLLPSSPKSNHRRSPKNQRSLHRSSPSSQTLRHSKEISPRKSLDRKKAPSNVADLREKLKHKVKLKGI